MSKRGFVKINNEKIYVQIIVQIENLIERGILKPGDKLPTEPILAEQLGTSRPPLREALSALEILGIIERRGRRGSFVKASIDTVRSKRRIRKLSEDVSPYEALEARKVVEIEIVRRAAETATKKDIENIKKAVQGMKKKIEELGSSLTFGDIAGSDIKFHLSIAEATHNGILIETMRYMLSGVREKLWREMKMRVLGPKVRFDKDLSEHNDIVDALTKKDGLMARNKMYEHLDRVEQEMFGLS